MSPTPPTSWRSSAARTNKAQVLRVASSRQLTRMDGGGTGRGASSARKHTPLAAVGWYPAVLVVQGGLRLCRLCRIATVTLGDALVRGTLGGEGNGCPPPPH